MTRKTLVAFVLGWVLATILANTRTVQADSAIMFGSFGGVAKAIALDTNGNLKLVVN